MQKVDLFGVLETISGYGTPDTPNILSSKTPNKKVTLESRGDVRVWSSFRNASAIDE